MVTAQTSPVWHRCFSCFPPRNARMAVLLPSWPWRKNHIFLLKHR